MSDDLHTRIQAIVLAHGTCECGEDAGTCSECAYHLADAVIRELGLHEETMHNPNGAILTRLDGKVLADNRYMRRWATNWEADESPVK